MNAPSHVSGQELGRPMNSTSHRRAGWLAALVCLTGGLMALGSSACVTRAMYPRCSQDAECLGHAEVCVNGQCQECATADHCERKYPGEHRLCQAGRCEKAAECTTDVQCQSKGAGFVCRSGSCTPECTANEQCQSGQRCVSQRCVASCASDVDCPNEGVCVSGTCMDAASALRLGQASCRPTKAGDAIRLDTVQFPFNQSELSSEARDALARAAACLKQAPASLQIVAEGHCDDRGTQEYNLALGERRANAVLRYLETLGAPVSRIEVVSKGENEPTCSEANEACYSANRRVQFLQRTGN